MDTEKKQKTYKTIGEVAKELGLINEKNGKIQTHTIRYWEKQFKQIKPVIMAGKRRYYSEEAFNAIRQIKYLLKEKCLTINGVKKVLANKEVDALDDYKNIGINKQVFKTNKTIKNKIKNISKIIKELKKFK